MSEERSAEVVDEKLKLITGNLQEVVGVSEMKKILKTRDLRIYWGTAPTGAPHLGYLVPMMKIADFLRAGAHVTVLFADVHAVLDNLKSTFETVAKRVVYYEFLIREMLRLVGAPTDKIVFVRGSSFQYDREYTTQVYRMAAVTTVKSSKHAGSNVVKQSKSPFLSGLLYPILQALDEEFLGADAQFGGVDQRKIFMFARESLPKLGFKKRRIHLMNNLIPGLTKDGKMSASVPNSKIDFFDSDDTIKRKFRKAFSVDGEVEGNCLLCVLKHVLMPMIVFFGVKFVVKRDEKYGGDMQFSSYEQCEKAFAAGELQSADLKSAVAREVIALIWPLREALLKKKKLYDEAYP